MELHQLQQLVRTAARVSGGRDVVVIGSAAVLAAIPAPTGALVPDDEADLFFADAPEAGGQIDTALGAGSMYHGEHGVCARAVGPLTALAPAGWRDRVIPLVAVDGAPIAHCMAPRDLVLAKLTVGRGKDIAFAEAALAAGIVTADSLLALVDQLPVPSYVREDIARRIRVLDR